MKVSIQQAQRAFETFAATSETTWKTMESVSQPASAGMRALNEKIAEITRGNANANFALALKLRALYLTIADEGQSAVQALLMLGWK